jgi:UPF0716 protein FxsA
LRRWPRLVATGFVLLILLEILIFAWVADHIGLGLTLLALISSAAAGLWVIHHTGLEMVGRLRLALAQGQEPGHSLIDGACFVIAGVLLIVPGFFTDLLALVLILPVSRNWFIRRFASAFGTPMAAGGGKAGSTIITDVEFREVHEEAEAAADQPAAQSGDAAAAAEAQQPRFEPQIFVPTKPERGGTQIRPGVIDVEPEIEAPEIEAPEIEAPDSDAETDAADAGAADSATEDAAEAKAPDGEPDPQATTDAPGNLGKAPRRPIIDVEED